jgi:hypothetical protein
MDRQGLPNFLVIGAMKAGTTSVWEYLRRHPQVFMSPVKEPSFFIDEGTWSRGRAWYESLFRGSDGAIAVGEASTAYSKHPIHPGVPERIAGLIPWARFIYMVRDPIERIRSQYEYGIDRGLENVPLARAVLEHPEYLAYSRYALQIDRYLDWFPRERLLVVTSEELRAERPSTLRRIFEFLGVDPGLLPGGLDSEYNVTDRREPRPAARRLRRMPGYRRIAAAMPSKVKSMYWGIARRDRASRNGADLPDDVRREVEERLAEDVVRLRTLLGGRFHGWGIA